MGLRQVNPSAIKALHIYIVSSRTTAQELCRLTEVMPLNKLEIMALEQRTSQRYKMPVCTTYVSEIFILEDEQALTLMVNMARGCPNGH